MHPGELGLLVVGLHPDLLLAQGDHGQQGLARGDDHARLGQLAADDAVAGRDDGAVGALEQGRVQGRLGDAHLAAADAEDALGRGHLLLGGSHRGRGHLVGGHGLVELLLRDGLPLIEGGEALAVGLGQGPLAPGGGHLGGGLLDLGLVQGQGRPGLHEARLGALDGGVVVPGIDGGDHLARLHGLVLLHRQGLERAGDAGGHAHDAPPDVGVVR